MADDDAVISPVADRSDTPEASPSAMPFFACRNISTIWKRIEQMLEAVVSTAKRPSRKLYREN